MTLVWSCSSNTFSSLPKAESDKATLTKQTKTTRMGEWANLHATDFASWNVLGVKEYGYLPQDYFSYDDTNPKHKFASAPKGVRTMTSDTYVSPQLIPNELAGKIEYWLAREVRNTFYEKVYVTKEFSPIFQPNPRKTGDVFYFQNTPINDVERFSEALLTSGIDKIDIPKIIRSCSYLGGWRGLVHLDPKRPIKRMTSYEKQMLLHREKDFYESCYGYIYKYSPYNALPPMNSLKRLPPTFDNSPYITRSYRPRNGVITSYKGALIKEVIDYDELNQGWYDAGFLGHLKGKYGVDIKQRLKHNINRNSFYKKDKLRVMVVLGDAKQLLSEHEFLDEQYYFNLHTHMNFTSHILESVFGINNAKGLYRDYYARVNAMQGVTQYGLNNNKKEVLSRFNGKCNFDLTKVQLAYKSISRFELDCLHAPISTGNDDLDSSDYHAYSSIKSVKEASNNVVTSHVTLFSLPERGNIYGGVTPIDVNVSAIQFELERDHLEMDLNYIHAEQNGGLVNGKVDPLQPEADFLSNFAMTLAKNFPPNALVSWVSELSPYGYVFHHGVLWRFPVVELRSNKNEMASQTN